MKNVMLKSVLFAVMALFISASSFATPADKGVDTQNVNSEIVGMMDIDVDMWLTSKEGCKFHIVGNVSWTGHFSGSVTGTSGEPCPNGEWTFGISAPGGDIIISGDEEIVDFMNGEPGLVREMALRMGIIE